MRQTCLATLSRLKGSYVRKNEFLASDRVGGSFSLVAQRLPGSVYRNRDGFRASRRNFATSSFQCAPEIVDEDPNVGHQFDAQPQKASSESDFNRATAHLRRRKAEWKRTQEGSTFVDHAIITVVGGHGGNGAVAFHREKFKPNGPPSGGNGSAGGSIYIRAVPHLNSLAPLGGGTGGNIGINSGSGRTVIRATNGLNGKGGFMNGAKVDDLVLEVPVGTIVRELPPRGTSLLIAGEDDALEQSSTTTSDKPWNNPHPEDERHRMFVHYPGFDEQNEGSPAFLQAEETLLRQRRGRRRDEYHRKIAEGPIQLDLDVPYDTPLSSLTQEEDGTLSSISKPATHNKSFYDRTPVVGSSLLVRGGAGGYGNAHFVTSHSSKSSSLDRYASRSPKFASRGLPGGSLTLSLELKILADIGLVGLPNAGKSSLLRVLTRAKPRVGHWMFTTLNTQVGVVKMFDDGSFDGGGSLLKKSDEDLENQKSGSSDFDPLSRLEALRFTIADNPGLLSGAGSSNIGLGHTFLRSIERSLGLVYVVDFSNETGPEPWNDVEVVRTELEAYKKGLSRKAKVILANKADATVSTEAGIGADHEEVEAGRAKLEKLREYAARIAAEDSEADGVEYAPMEVIPVSAKHGQNLRAVVRSLGNLVAQGRQGVS